MPIKSVFAALLTAVSVVVVVTVLRRRLDAGGRDPVAPAPPRVSDFTHRHDPNG